MINKRKILQEFVLPASQVIFWVMIGGLYAAFTRMVVDQWPVIHLWVLAIDMRFLTSIGVILLFFVMLRLFPVLYKATQKFLEKL
ncbi:MAG TPA: hypothetical protein VMT46_13030 [Anaerolineaceae bacterium]|nr:hypothetical protein [Anaerolineaceae bacterium]